MRIVNSTRQTILAEEARIANTMIARMRGLLGRSILADQEALVIIPCSSVHMFFMRFSIDVLFVDKNETVVGLCPSLPPWALSPVFMKSHCAIELPAGKIKATGTGIGDLVRIEDRGL